MRAAHPEQQQRLYAKLCRELGTATLTALGDPDVTEVMCNPDGALWVESHAKGMRELDDRLTESQVESLIGTVAALLGTVVHGRAPIVEGELPINGYRFEGILPPVANAPTFVIRKHASQVYSLDDYVKAGILTPTQRKVLLDGVRERRNIVIAGGTASGKTTLANAVMREIVAVGDPSERIVILEDTRELQCEARNAVQLHTGDVADLTRLVRITMRLRPDRIIVGEVRGGEALALLKAWNTGHPGGITTIHANSAAAALLRLDSLIQESGAPPQPRLVAEAVELVVFIARTPEGRRVREVVRVSSYDAVRESYVLEPVEPAPMEDEHA
jgi:type IV secretion system protein VirB11